jgi:hypothetical protein
MIYEICSKIPSHSTPLECTVQNVLHRPALHSSKGLTGGLRAAVCQKNASIKVKTLGFGYTGIYLSFFPKPVGNDINTDR